MKCKKCKIEPALFASVRGKRICKNCGAVYIWIGVKFDPNKTIEEYSKEDLKYGKVGTWSLQPINKFK